MLTAAAVCPHPPLLIPEATGAPGAADQELGRLRAACDQAVAALLAGRPDLVVVVGSNPATARAIQYPPDAVAGLHEFGVPFTLGGPPGRRDDSPVLPLSLTIGKWLLWRAGAGPGAPAAWWGIAASAPPAECLELGRHLAALAPRVAMLALGDGPGRRARRAPGAADPEADRYDDQVAAALSLGDPGALAALDSGHDGRLFIAGRAAWQVLAGAAGPEAGRFDAELRYRGVPYEVSYVVASWRLRA